MNNKKVFWLSFAIGVACICLLLVGCNMDNNTPKGDGVIPESLDEIEDEASDIADDISEGDWRKVESSLAEIERQWEKYEPMAKEAGALQSQIDNFNEDLRNLKKLVQDKKAYGASLAANKLAMSAMDFMGLHSESFSIIFEKLELYEKQILLTSKNDDWEQAKIEQEAARDTWNSIKPKAENINADRTKKVDDIMAAIPEAIELKDAKELRGLCDDLDDELDRLEDDFER